MRKDMKILVTGVKGQLGYDVCRELKERGYSNYLGIDIDDLDLTNEQKVDEFIRKHNPDIVINNAAWTAVDKAEEFQDKVSELQTLRKQMETMNENSPHTQYEKKLQDSTLLFCAKIANFIEQVGGYIWLTDKINEIPELEREGYIRAIHMIKEWADTMEYNINNKLKELN